jgi:hypothetical protein
VTDADYQAVKATFPWTEHVVADGKRTLVKVIDNAGNEVPIFTMTAFLTMITAKIAGR